MSKYVNVGLTMNRRTKKIIKMIGKEDYANNNQILQYI